MIPTQTTTEGHTRLGTPTQDANRAGYVLGHPMLAKGWPASDERVNVTVDGLEFVAGQAITTDPTVAKLFADQGYSVDGRTYTPGRPFVMPS